MNIPLLDGAFEKTRVTVIVERVLILDGTVSMTQKLAEGQTDINSPEDAVFVALETIETGLASTFRFL